MWMLLTVLGACRSPAPPSPPVPRFAQDWVALYYMPYDNDLSHAAQVVLGEIQRGTRGGVPAAVLADTAGPGGVRLLTFDDGLGRVYPDPEREASAEIETFRSFLEQASTLYEARRYLITILDHGGRLDALARDDHPAGWLGTEEVAAEITRFREQEAGEVELLFLQVCAKGTVETAWTFREAARYTLAAQGNLGAPNNYYARVLAGLGQRPDTDGASLAATIAAQEGPEMYTAYTCIDNAPLAALPERLSGFSPGRADPSALGPVSYAYAGDTYLDAAALARASGDVELADWLVGAVICGHHVATAPHPRLTEGMPASADLSGLSFYLPPSTGFPPDYRSVSVYQQTDLAAQMMALAQREP